jgi:uncharacterized damage-inducible protein DinB
MPTFQTKILISNLQQDVRNTLVEMEGLKGLPDDVLLQQPEAGKWSIAQVLEHLNGYNRFYLTEIKKALEVTTVSTSPVFKSGWIGNYFTNLMQPRENGTLAKKMSSPKEYNFPPDLDAGRVVQEFIEGQQKLLVLLDNACNADMGKRVPISISKWIKLKLGDTFRFLIAHQVRHFMQISRVRTAVVKNNAA